MDETYARTLCELNTRFYAAHAASFSATRQNAWQGWKRSLEVIEAKGGLADDAGILDIASGNGRFERFLSERHPEAGFVFHAIDNCPELIAAALEGTEGLSLDISNVDIMHALIEKSDIVPFLETTPYELAVCFGFMHHIPLDAWREHLLRALLRSTRRGGYVIVSFWQFLNDEGLAERARSTTNEAILHLGLNAAELGPNDYLLGWQDKCDAYRYCHNTTDAEIDALLAEVSDEAVSIARFKADGRGGNLNSYAVLERS